MKEDEMELSLELSIGGCYKNIHETENAKIHEIDENNTSSRSDVSETYAVGCVQDENFSSDSADPRRRREIQALRRREAIMKREEKQKRWARSKGGVNDRSYLEMQQNQARVIDRGGREKESSEEFLMKKARGNGANSNMNGDDKDICFNNLVQPVSYNKCFKVLQNGNSCGDSNLEHRNQRIGSNGLVERSPSVFLDYQSTSHKARSSSTDTGSHSNYSQGGQQQSSTTATSNTPERSDLNGPSSNARSDQVIGKTANLLPMISSVDVPTPECSNPRKCEPINKPTPTTQEQTSSASKLCSNESAIKPPISQSNNPNSSALPRMPLVSTTGNGPNGKTVNGFLYNYSKSEVSIVCVCHGSSFSPAEFVEHAGGIEISHPLKHITIVPTPFG